MPSAGRYAKMNQAERDAQKARIKDWWAKLTPEQKLAKRRNYSRKSLYELTQEQFDALVEAQEGRCALCRRVPKGVLYVDHDHATKVVRGLLCNKCNRGLGYFGDTPEGLMRAFLYVSGQLGE